MTALEEIKQQMGVLLLTILNLNTAEQQKAVEFLEECIKNFRVLIPTYNSKSSPSEMCKTLSAINSCLQQDENLLGSEIIKHNTIDLGPCEKLVCEESNNCFQPSDETTVSEPLFSETPNCKSVSPLKKSRRKQLHTRKRFTQNVSSNDTSPDSNLCSPGDKALNLSMNIDDALKDDVVDQDGLQTAFISRNVLNKRLKKLYKAKRLQVISKNKEIHKCPSCFKAFETENILILHMKTHSKDPVSCRTCRLTFRSTLKFWQHNVKGLCENRLHICPKCNAPFKYRRHYLKHMHGHSENDCKYCDDKFSTYQAYKEHLEMKHKGITIEKDMIPCKFCCKSFGNLPALYNHYRLKHSRGKFVCVSCGMFVPTKERFKEHCMLHELEKRFECELCHAKFYRRQQLIVHSELHKSEKYKCFTCNVSVTSLKELYKHKSGGHKVKGLEPKFECAVCLQKFTRKSNLRDHLTSHFKTKSLKCEPCRKKFRTSEALYKHIKTKKHLKNANVVVPESQYEKIYEDKFICESCGKQYKSRQDLTHHLRTHKTTYKCEVCEKTFSLKVNLTKHMKQHNKTDTFICELCGTSFGTLTSLQGHNLYKHSQVCVVKCSVCGKGFKRNSELNRHMLIHENKRNFVCECGQAYKQSAHLKKHKMSAHSKLKISYENYTNQNQSIPQGVMMESADRNQLLDSCNGLNFNHPNVLVDDTLFQQNQVLGFKCEMCFKVMKRKSDYVRHLQTHDVKRVFVCYCGHSFKQLTSLKRHQMAMHGDGDVMKLDTMQVQEDLYGKEHIPNEQMMQDKNLLVTMTHAEEMNLHENHGINETYNTADMMHVKYNDLNFPSSTELTSNEYSKKEYVALDMESHMYSKHHGADMCGKPTDISHYGVKPDHNSQVSYMEDIHNHETMYYHQPNGEASYVVSDPSCTLTTHDHQLEETSDSMVYIFPPSIVVPSLDLI